jgi:hypothetical protein
MGEPFTMVLPMIARRGATCNPNRASKSLLRFLKYLGGLSWNHPCKSEFPPFQMGDPFEIVENVQPQHTQHSKMCMKDVSDLFFVARVLRLQGSHFHVRRECA